MMSLASDYEKAAALIEAFVDGRSGRWDWDDFTSTKKNDAFLESVRNRCVAIRGDHPEEEGARYCSEAGLEVLRAIAKDIRAKTTSVRHEKNA
jgi:hypothetical protein